MDEHTHHWRTEKILTIEEGVKTAEKLRAEGKTIATVNGAFDLLHAGHLDMLEEAKEQADFLFVGINSDQSIKDKKGPLRPLIPELERAAMLAALTCIDYIIILDFPYDQVQDELILNVKPNVHVNGSEYGSPEKWIDWAAMQKVGAKGHMVHRRPGLATTDIVKKIQLTK